MKYQVFIMVFGNSSAGGEWERWDKTGWEGNGVMCQKTGGNERGGTKQGERRMGDESKQGWDKTGGRRKRDGSKWVRGE